MRADEKSTKLEVIKKANRNTQEQCRAKININLLIKKLENHIDDKCDLSPTQVKSIELLLQRSLPVLSASTITADVNHNNTSATQDTLLAIRALSERLVNGTASLYSPRPESVPVVIDQQTQQVVDS
jgi:glutathionyl-hydroquinone reductase